MVAEGDDSGFDPSVTDENVVPTPWTGVDVSEKPAAGRRVRIHSVHHLPFHRLATVVRVAVRRRHRSLNRALPPPRPNAPHFDFTTSPIDSIVELTELRRVCRSWESASLAATGLETGVSTILAAGTTPASDDIRPSHIWRYRQTWMLRPPLGWNLHRLGFRSHPM